MQLDLMTSQHFVRPSLYAHTRERNDHLDIAARTFENIERGVLKVDIRERFDLHHAADAHRAVESRLTRGAIVLLP